MATIKIYDGNPVTKRLVLSDGGHSSVKQGRSIKWKIKNSGNSKVATIENIIVRTGAEIFSELPDNTTGKWRAKIDKKADSTIECKYSIFWKAKGKTETLEYDPKISVKPSFSILPIVIGLVSFVSVAFLFSKISKR